MIYFLICASTIKNMAYLNSVFCFYKIKTGLLCTCFLWAIIFHLICTQYFVECHLERLHGLSVICVQDAKQCITYIGLHGFTGIRLKIMSGFTRISGLLISIVTLSGKKSPWKLSLTLLLQNSFIPVGIYLFQCFYC